MTTPGNPALASLKDIQPPTEIGTWPLAYGYWLAIFAGVALTITLIYLLKQRRNKYAVQKAALKQLDAMDLQHPQFVIEVSSLLKRAAMSTTNRQQVAKLSGNDWTLWLNAQVKTPQDELCQLLAKRFQPNSFSNEEKQRLKIAASNWLKSALPLKPSKHQTSSEVLPC
ncbi:DUF4381 domain-containing protein [Shewanella marinintestina]|uniref:DUF4381 domain-containing protein n=1 Tax=Shewanella marinintestina TaxID=190305 RepID=UPI00200C8E35|nr:DUF4381 domain-containing protein [Shewanella marinintestina]MCL1148398.1 DUF4381 domain-containing protein [Shewanella marinintestina]